MTDNSNEVVVGVFDSSHQAEKAVADLNRAGFNAEVLTGPASGTETGLGAADGKLVGGTAASAIASIHLADLLGQGVPVSDVHFYEQEFRSGRTIVIVPPGERTAEARTIVHGHGGYDATLLHCPTAAGPQAHLRA